MTEAHTPLTDYAVLEAVTLFEEQMRGLLGEELAVSVVLRRGDRLNMVTSETDYNRLQRHLVQLAKASPHFLRQVTEADNGEPSSAA